MSFPSASVHYLSRLGGQCLVLQILRAFLLVARPSIVLLNTNHSPDRQNHIYRDRPTGLALKPRRQRNLSPTLPRRNTSPANTMSLRTVAIAALLLSCLGAVSAKSSFIPLTVRDIDSPTMSKRECESCFNGEQCISGNCYNRKCVVDLSPANIKVCNQEECAPCQTRLTCSSNRCMESPIGNKCVKNSKASLHKCFPAFYPDPELVDASPAPL